MALCRSTTVLAELLLHNPRSHSERLLTSVDLLLTEAGLAPGDLAAVAVSAGPGSFTGLRIGVAAAKGLAFSLGLPLFGVPTLEVLAANAPPGKRHVCTVLDARRGEIFAALFTVGSEGPVKIRAEALFSPADLVESLPAGTLVMGTIPPSLRDLLFDAGAAVAAPPLLNFPRASAVAFRGALMLARNEPSQTDTLVPFYLRPSDAETNRKRASSRRKTSGNRDR